MGAPERGGQGPQPQPQLRSRVLDHRVPDTAKVRDKMKYSGTKEAMKSAFVGISVNINATDLDELTEELVAEACNKV